MIEWIVSSCILIAAVLLLRLVFRDKVSKRLQYAMWALVVLRLLIPGSIAESAASIGNLLSSVTEKPVMQAATGTLTEEQRYDIALNEVLTEHAYSEEVYTALPLERQEAIAQEYEPEVQQKLESYTKAYDTAQVLKVLWLAGACVMGLCLLISNLRFGLRLRRSRQKLETGLALRVYHSSAVHTPCLFGLFRPAVYLPEDVPAEGQALEYILAHEQTHYRHLDHIWSALRCICLALHWYNPLVWVAVKASRTDSELACDEGTLAKLGDDSRESYGRTLIEMSCAKPSMADYLLTATTMTGDKKSLYRRIQAIVKKPKFILSAVIILAAVSLVIVGCTFTGAKNDSTEATTAPTTETTQPTETTAPTETTVPVTTVPPTTLPPETTAPPQPPEFPLGKMGEKTNGTLRSLTLNLSPFCDAYPFGENILLCQPQSGIYQVRSLKDGSTLAKVTDRNHANFATVTDAYVIYYSLITKQIIFRDRNLEVVKTLDFTLNDMVAEMLFSQDGKKAYYCEDQQTLVELDLETMEPRMMYISGPPIWALSGLYFEDTILSYWGKEDGKNYYAFINLATGGYIGKDTNMSKLQVWDHNYFLTRAYRGTVERLVVLDGSHRYMIPEDHGKRSTFASVLPQLNGFFTLSYSYDSTEVVLDLYDLDTKTRVSSITVDLGGEYGSSAKVFTDENGQYIWLCAKVGKGSGFSNYDMILYRWDFRADAIEDTTVYGYGG